MEKKITIAFGDAALSAVLFETPTAQTVWDALPFSAEVQTWGDELYFAVPVDAALEEGACDVVQKGDLGYWPSGSAFCIFFGPTPVSRPGEIRPASAVNVFGRLAGDMSVPAEIRPGSPVAVTKAER